MENSAFISEQTGVDTANYLLLLPADSIYHIDNHHAFDGNNQRPIQPQDYDVVWQILAMPDSVRLGDTVNGLQRLVVTKKLNNESYRCVFEVRNSPKNRALVLITMAIRT